MRINALDLARAIHFLALAAIHALALPLDLAYCIYFILLLLLL